MILGKIADDRVVLPVIFCLVLTVDQVNKSRTMQAVLEIIRCSCHAGTVVDYSPKA